MKSQAQIKIIGGGLAGCEAAWQAAAAGCSVTLYEMKPDKFSAAHETDLLGELVCSNSLRSDDLYSAVGLLKEEMTRLGSLIMQTARTTAVPAGKALAVDRRLFAESITEAMETSAAIKIVRQEITELPDSADIPCIVATGPLTSDPMVESLSRITGEQRLAFYDAIAPIIEADSLDMDVVYRKSRWDDGPGDYLNCPMDREQYLHFIEELRHGTNVPLRDFEEVKYFEGCLPIEVMCERGDDTLRFGPMKPVGLEDPRTGREPYAVVQLRTENIGGSHYNMVGFQTKLSYGEQKRIFRLIPGMEQAVFSRFGSIHRNTFIHAPELLTPTLQLQKRPNLLIAGQLSGVEGYLESAAMGLIAGINAARLARRGKTVVPPKTTALGALISHLSSSSPKGFQPSNVNFGLFPPFNKKIPKKFRGQERAKQALADLRTWMDTESLQPAPLADRQD